MSDPCEKIMASMRPAIRAFHHNQFLRKQRDIPPRTAEELYRMAQEQKNRKGKIISGSLPEIDVERDRTPEQTRDSLSSV